MSVCCFAVCTTRYLELCRKCGFAPIQMKRGIFFPLQSLFSGKFSLGANFRDFCRLLYMQCHVKSVQDLLYGILVSQVLLEVMS